MKKIIASVAALSMCAFMLAACGDKTTGDSTLTESITAGQTAGENNAAADDSSDSDKTEAKTEASDDAAENDAAQETEAEKGDSGDAAASYASLDEFINSDDIFDREGELIDSENTNTYKFMSSLDIENGNGFYMDVEATDGSMKATMAAAEDQVSINMSGDGVDVSFIIKDNTMYLLESRSKKAVYMELDEEAIASNIEQYSAGNILGNAVDADISDIPGAECYEVNIGGDIYAFEMVDDAGFLYDPSGDLCAMVSSQAGTTYAFIINEFTLNVPANAFDIPSDYELVDAKSLDTSEFFELFGAF